MAKINSAAALGIKPKKAPRTAEGAPAKHITPASTLARVLNACLLWEDNFYVDGKTIGQLFGELVKQVTPDVAYTLAVKARTEQKLRHAPLLVAREMARASVAHRAKVADTLAEIVQRPDELAEFLAIYWSDVQPTKPRFSWETPKKLERVFKKQPIAKQVKLGLARAFQKFDEYALAKYNRDGAIKLRDVLFLIHAKPKDKVQEALWKRLVNGELATPDTWEVALSAGANKKETFERLISEGNLGALALLRNLRNMKESGVKDSLIREAILDMKTERVLPFRFITAARYAPAFESELQQAMFKCLEKHDKLEGKTVLLVDVSGSMDSAISAKSELKRLDAAAGLAMLLAEICEDVVIYTFSDNEKLVPSSRRGFALAEAISRSQAHSGTYLGRSSVAVAQQVSDYDRVIVLTDEQSHDKVTNPFGSAKAYMINVAANQYGVGYGNGWSHIDGWSESVVDYIIAEEDEEQGWDE